MYIAHESARNTGLTVVLTCNVDSGHLGNLVDIVR
jgi:hypothetical protein